MTDDEWAFAAFYLTLMREDAPQRQRDLREVFNTLRWMARAGSSWRMLPWRAVYQQPERWIDAGTFDDVASRLGVFLRLGEGRRMLPTAAVIDSRTLRSTVGSGWRIGYDGDKRTRGARSSWPWTRSGTCWSFAAADAAAAHGVELRVMKLPGKGGFGLLPRRWVVERTFAWLARGRRLAREYERLAKTAVGLHYAAFTCPMLGKVALLIAQVQEHPLASAICRGRRVICAPGQRRIAAFRGRPARKRWWQENRLSQPLRARPVAGEACSGRTCGDPTNAGGGPASPTRRL